MKQLTQLKFIPHGNEGFFVRRYLDGDVNQLIGTVHKASGEWAFQFAECATSKPILLYSSELAELNKFVKRKERIGKSKHCFVISKYEQLRSFTKVTSHGAQSDRFICNRSPL